MKLGKGEKKRRREEKRRSPFLEMRLLTKS